MAIANAGMIAPPAAPQPGRTLSGPISISFLVLVVAGVGASLSLDALIPPTVPRGVAASLLAGSPLLVTILVFAVVGFLIVRSQGRNAVGWILLGAAASLSITQVFAGYKTNAAYSPAGTYPLPGVVSLVGNLTFAIAAWLTIGLLPLLFPDGRLLSRRWVWVVRFGVTALLVWQVTRAVDPASTAPVANPIGIPAAARVASTVGQLAVAAVVATIIPGIVSVALRYRRGTTETRLQLRWFLAACVGMLVVTLVPILRLPDLATNSVMAGGYSLAPIAIGLAVARYRLYEIDVVINRALVYGTLAAFITAVYVAVVAGLGSLVGSNGRPNLGLSIVATALVAVAFQPVRERVQAVANRLVYGTRATPYQVLSRFSARVAETYASSDVLPRMAQVLAEGTGAEGAEVWLRSGNQLRAAASWPAGANAHDGSVRLTGLLPEIPGADRAVPVRHQGELLGALTVKKRAGETLTPIEEKLLEDLAHQAGLVLKNVGLTADLQARLEDLRASRQRLVRAQDDERRKLERNLHDGAQQYLVALKVKLGLAEMLADRDPDRARVTIKQLKDDADEALEALRDLARGIYPPLLAEDGLAVALGAQARKAAVAVTIDAEGIGRYPQEVEAAVYFCCLEALQNVQKYAVASQAVVRLREHSGELSFEVQDDGGGFDAATTRRGSGLTNMADRLDALGGAIELNSSPGAGTQLRGVITLRSAALAALAAR